MKTVLAPVWLGFALLVQGGCFVPLGNTAVSEQAIGTRAEAAANASTAVILRVVTQRILAPMTENGYGKDYLLREQYYLKRGEEETRLHFLEISWSDVMTHGVTKPPYSLREIEPEVRSIHGTTSWIAVRVRKVEHDYLDVEVIVFDEALRHREIVIERIQRRNRSPRIFIGNLEFADGNRQIVVHKDEGQFALDPLTLALTKL
jgi:hypothetical protein